MASTKPVSIVLAIELYKVFILSSCCSFFLSCISCFIETFNFFSKTAICSFNFLICSFKSPEPLFCSFFMANWAFKRVISAFIVS